MSALRSFRIRRVRYALLSIVFGAFTLSAHGLDRNRDANLIFRCRGSSKIWSARVDIDEGGKFDLNAAKANIHFHCKLNLIHFSYSPHDEVPRLAFALQRAKCFKEDGSPFEDAHLLGEPNILVSVNGRSSVDSKFQWIVNLPPTDCRIEVENDGSISRNYEKWLHQLWPNH